MECVGQRITSSDQGKRNQDFNLVVVHTLEHLVGHIAKSQPKQGTANFRSFGYTGRLQMKSCSVSGEVLLTHRLSEHIFLLRAWHPGQGVVRDQGVFPSLVQDRGSGTQQCHTIQNCCHGKAWWIMPNNPFFVGRRHPWFGSLLPSSFL